MKIARMGNPVLRMPARQGRGSDGALGAPPRRGHDRDDGGCRRHRPRRAPGAPALADRRLFRLRRTPQRRCRAIVAQDLTVLINPVVEPVGRGARLGWEGCLSVPGLRGVVPRHLPHPLSRAAASTAKPSSARPKAFTPASCSTNAIISTAFFIRSACTDQRLLMFLEELRAIRSISRIFSPRRERHEKPARR